MKRKFLFVCSLALAATIGWAQITSDFTLTANPSLNIPLGPFLADGTPFYSIGGGISLKGEYSPPFAQFLYSGFAFDADLIPINSSTKTLTLLSLGLELGAQFYPVPSRLSFHSAAHGGVGRAPRGRRGASLCTRCSIVYPFTRSHAGGEDGGNCSRGRELGRRGEREDH